MQLSGDIDFTHAQVHVQSNAPPMYRWLAKEIERWVLQTDSMETEVEIEHEVPADRSPADRNL